MLAVLTDARLEHLERGRPDPRRQRAPARHRPPRRARHRGDGPHLRGDPRRAPRRRAVDDRHCPHGFGCHVANVGVKDDTDDFVVIAADAAGRRGRRVHAQPLRRPERDDQPRAPRRRARPGRSSSCRRTPTSPTAPPAAPTPRRSSPPSPTRLGCAPGDVLVASTGVIGRRYPLDRIARRRRRRCRARPTAPTPTAAATGIMTTDTVPKVAAARSVPAPARVVGIAKGVGMIEPDMATMIAVAAHRRRRRRRPSSTRVFRRVVDRTFNCVSIDTDTSTSDTAVVLASGAAGPVDGDELEAALGDVAESLTKQIARDGEGAETLIEVVVDARPRSRPRPSGWPRRSSTRRSSRRPCTAPTPTGAGWRWRSASARTTPTSTRSGSSSASATGRCTRRRSTTPSSPSCPTTSAATRSASTSRLGTGDADVHGVGLRPHRRLRPHQRRLHHLTRRATRHLGADVSDGCFWARTSRHARPSAPSWDVFPSGRVATPRVGMDIAALDDLRRSTTMVSITRAQAERLRHQQGDAGIRALSRRAVSSVIHPGVARTARCAATTPEQADRRRGPRRARPSVASHRSAARLWGIPRPDGDPVEVIRHRRRTRSPDLDGVHRPPTTGPEGPHARAAGRTSATSNVLRLLCDLGAVDPSEWSGGASDTS